MKKIVGILGMAAMLGSAAFAAEPAANFVLADFSGSAEFGFKSNLAAEKVEYGMYNDSKAGIKFGLITDGTKATTGDGVWGELQIKYADGLNWQKDADHDGAIPALAMPSVEAAKIHLMSGDFSAALNILSPSLEYGAYAPFVATPEGGVAAVWGADNTAADDAAKIAAAQAVLQAKKDAVTAAKAAYEKSGDFKDYVKYEAAKGDLAATEAIIKNAKPAAPAGKGIIGDNDGLTNGFGLELAMADMFTLNFKLKDNGVAADKKFGVAFDAALKAVDNLDASVAASFNFGTKHTGFMATSAYKLAIDDVLYVKPGVSYAMTKIGDAKATNDIRGGVMFGWGAVDQEPGLDFIPNKTNEGVSVSVNYNTVSKALGLNAGLYDQSLFNMLGLENAGTLKTGVAFQMTNTNTSEKSSSSDSYVAAAVKYDVTFSPVYVSLHAGMRTGFGSVKVGDTTTKTEKKPQFKYGVTLGSREVIDNTDIFVAYEGAYAGKVTTSELKIGSKISF